MRIATKLAFLVLLGALAFASLPGCAIMSGVKEPDVKAPIITPPTEDVAAKQKPRKEEVLSNFERRRDSAQLQAAADRLQKGDAATAEMMLKKLLERNADFAPARLLLTRVLVDRQDYAAAEQHLRQIIEKFPKEAAAHYELGLLLDELNRTDESVVSLAKATELEPSNELYRLSHQSLTSAGAPPRGAVQASLPQR